MGGSSSARSCHLGTRAHRTSPSHCEMTPRKSSLLLLMGVGGLFLLHMGGDVHWRTETGLPQVVAGERFASPSEGIHIVLPSGDVIRPRAGSDGDGHNSSDSKESDRILVDSGKNGMRNSDSDETPWDVGMVDSQTMNGNETAIRELVDEVRLALGDNEIGRAVILLSQASSVSEGRFQMLRHLTADAQDEDVAIAILALWTAPYGSPAYLEDLKALASLRCPVLGEWMAQAMRNVSNTEDVWRIVGYLSSMQGPSVVESLTDCLAKTDDVDSRGFLLHVLRNRRAPDEVNSLVNALGSDDADVRMAAAVSLANVGGGEAIHALAEASRNPVLSSIVTEALAGSRSPFSRAALMDVAADARRPGSVRIAALKALTAFRLDGTSQMFISELDAGVCDQQWNALTSYGCRGRRQGTNLSATNGDERWF